MEREAKSVTLDQEAAFTTGSAYRNGEKREVLCHLILVPPSKSMEYLLCMKYLFTSSFPVWASDRWWWGSWGHLLCQCKEPLVYLLCSFPLFCCSSASNTEQAKRSHHFCADGVQFDIKVWSTSWWIRVEAFSIQCIPAPLSVTPALGFLQGPTKLVSLNCFAIPIIPVILKVL